MIGRVDVARDLITSKNIGLSTIRLQPGSFQKPGSFSRARTNARERRIATTFPTINVPTVFYHGLGFAPSGFQQVGKSQAGDVYAQLPLSATSRVIVLYATAVGTYDILVR